MWERKGKGSLRDNKKGRNRSKDVKEGMGGNERDAGKERRQVRKGIKNG